MGTGSIHTSTWAPTVMPPAIAATPSRLPPVIAPLPSARSIPCMVIRRVIIHSGSRGEHRGVISENSGGGVVPSAAEALHATLFPAVIMPTLVLSGFMP